ncbi:hypothetical protein PF005_g2521 [Phytophthora fragariae]|uniref:Uncharacterized protein n=1 Tax=Phytophthora fragariae TaxID=53985 RepID=A0A6A3ZRC3_9STRA|nr:hypothetical protein PF003_g8267 [Phytophthora fragariae]KAE8939911.1 hypothetical protein PF009_g10261 [Phytophthora fragariae]KAE9014141.1 hypothetical protein PF011_g8185 [Phytophthora fragariae]KAE9117358.1 hypothetical protein PF010_g8628 [Phytophthora fragariae]KAE9135723.1 hypothetical protein PF007_g2457 [Phytophthora fragariae]
MLLTVLIFDLCCCNGAGRKTTTIVVQQDNAGPTCKMTMPTFLRLARRVDGISKWSANLRARQI